MKNRSVPSSVTTLAVSSLAAASLAIACGYGAEDEDTMAAGVSSTTPSGSSSSQTSTTATATGQASDGTSAATGAGTTSDTTSAGATDTTSTDTTSAGATDTTSVGATDTTGAGATDTTGAGATDTTSAGATDTTGTAETDTTVMDGDATGGTAADIVGGGDTGADDSTATADDSPSADDTGMVADDATDTMPDTMDMGAVDDTSGADDGTDDTSAMDDAAAADDMTDDTTSDETPFAGPTERPCDIYNAAGNECVAAYSMVRSLRADYDGPLYQVRSGSNGMNTGQGGELHDIPQTADGYADAAVQDDVCSGTTCTISLLYDQSGRENHLPVAKRGRSEGGEYADDDDFESFADAGPLTVAGHDVYSLFMDTREGYRLPGIGNGMARGTEPQAIYMLADGTHYGTACCWDFGNVVPDAAGQWQFMNTLFFGVAYWGTGAGNGPWFMADFEAGVWAGGSNPGEPGWGALDDDAPPNQNNPSLNTPFAIGFLKTASNYALRMADVQADAQLTTAYEGPMPKAMDNQGGIVLGVGGDNSNNSWGTFFEGAIVLGYPSDETEQAVMDNVKAAGYD